MAGPVSTTLAVTPGSGQSVAGFTDGGGNFAQSVSASANPAVNNTAWTSGTSGNTALTTNCAGYGTTIITYTVSGSITAGVVTFEVYDGTNWWAVPAVRLDGTYTEPTTYALASGSKAWQVNTAGFQQVRVRLSTAITGSGNATFQILVQAMNLIPSVQASLATALSQAIDSITTYPVGHSYTYISTATTTTPKTGSGVLQSIIIQGGTAGTIIAYDNVTNSGSLIFSFDTTNALASYMFNLAFNTGLTIVTSAATKLTVVWR